MRFARHGLRSAQGLAHALFREEPARALLAGIAAHSMLPLDAAASAAFGLVLGCLGHAVGWPVVRGGSQRIADGMAAHLRSLGAEIVTGAPIAQLDELPPARAILFDLTPRQVIGIAGSRLPASYRRALARYRYGPGVFKVDWAIQGEVPWRAPECRRAATVHLGGGLSELALSERACSGGQSPERPFVLLAQQSAFDETRAPPGRQAVWAYCHVPHGSDVDMTDRIEAQVERFAPGFRERVLARATMGPAALERYNANYVGGDIAGGSADLRQLFSRPAIRAVPYSTPASDLYICSSSTPPGAGVHGMCGYHAARAALRRAF